ncbi:hypothetical protein OE88DRAFT_920438 [Heliocybe sulcata]|uniref:GBD/FH3 domain-containing protein n=1 Tax=Heliocybe sulcata TaxID=5364 RepID=A0A5C3MPY9_9AGAM|nr:hypothetical protein OE88DRAFT_920438 [Heliocybe sulcata]
MKDFSINIPAISRMTSALSSPHIATRKLIMDLLVFFLYYDDSRGYRAVIEALIELSKAENEAPTPFAYWFKSWEKTMLGRGKMGSAVAASKEVREAGNDGLSEYTISNILALNGILEAPGDVRVRRYYLEQMEAAGLLRILALCRKFEVAAIHQQLDTFQEYMQEDMQVWRERARQDAMDALTGEENVYEHLQEKTIDNTSARTHLESTLRLLATIPDDGQALADCYRTINGVVRDALLDRTLSRTGVKPGPSVDRIISQFNDADRILELQAQYDESRARAARLKLDKDDLEAELDQKKMEVFELQCKLDRVEELLFSRATRSRQLDH